MALAVVFAASALGGCAGGLRSTRPAPVSVEREPVEVPAPEPEPDRLAAERAARQAAEARDREHRRKLPERIHAQIVRRMPRQNAALHQRVSGTILHEARRASVDPLLVLAVIHVESAFDHRAVSRAGAMGLMQVRGPTLREELKRARLPWNNPFDPTTNVRAGVRYLRRMLDAFGKLDVALIAYNAGPARVRELLARGTIPAPFRAYPRKVKSELERLRLALGVRPSGDDVVAAKGARMGPPPPG